MGTKEVGATHKGGRYPWCMVQGDGFTTEPSGIMEVAMWICALLLVGF